MIDKKMLDEVLEKTDRLFGLEEFKNYIKDFSDSYNHMGTRIDEQALMIIFSRALLLSINDGDGYETLAGLYMKMWAAICDREELFIDYNVLEYPDTKDKSDYHDERDVHLRRDLVLQWLEEETTLNDLGLKIFCLDISAWIDNIQGAEFRAVLSRLSHAMRNNIILFRIPAVDEMTLGRVKDAISWYINVDDVYCPPHSLDDYYNYALKKFSERNIVLDEDAHACLRELIHQVQRRPNFWGFRSVKKLVDDIMMNTIRGICE